MLYMYRAAVREERERITSHLLGENSFFYNKKKTPIQSASHQTAV